jgi:branched-chain amino acid transport system permease protein
LVGTVSFLIQCLNAVEYGLLLFLVASGLTLVFGAMGIINLAHGSFYMLGAYLAYGLSAWIAHHLSGGFFTAVGVGLLASIALGYLLEWAFFSLLYKRAHLQQVLMTYALILIFDELRSILAGDDVHGVSTPGWLSGAIPLGTVMTYPVYRLFICAVCLLVALALYLVLSRTRLGMAIRAAASDREMAQSLGVDVGRLYRAVFAGGVSLAVVAGMLAAPASSVYPGMGGQVLIVCFVIVVIGGIGSVHGAFAAALLVGLVDTFGKVFFQEAAGVLVYVMMAAVLVCRPEGLFRHG